MLSAAKQFARDVLRAGLKALGDEPVVIIKRVEFVLPDVTPGQVARDVARALVEQKRYRRSSPATTPS